jgi:zinc protease
MKVLSMLLVVVSACATSQGFRNDRPKTAQAPELHAPVPSKKVLSNGLTVLVVPMPNAPLVTLQITVKGGSSQDPAHLPGLANFAASMLKQGTRTQSAQQIADKVELLGASLGINTDEDYTDISTTALSDNFNAVLDVVSDVVLHPTFSFGEIERLRKQILAALQEIQNDPEQMADVTFRQALYGDHPYGHPTLGTEDGVRKISKSDLENFYFASLRPQNAAIVVVGNVIPDEVFSNMERRFGGWGNNDVLAGAPAVTHALAAQNVIVIDRRDAPQTQLRVGHLGVERTNPDYYPLVLCNAILGGLFNSRINMNLREDKGYTYGARSSFDFMRAAGPFVVSTGVRTDVTTDALKEIIKEIDKIRQNGVKPDELRNAKNRYTLSLPGYLQTTRGVATMIANIFVFDLPLDYYQQLPKNIEAVTLPDVQRVAKTHLHADKLLVTAVGDKRFIEAGLIDMKIGKVVIR